MQAPSVDYYRAQAEFCAELAQAIKRPDYQQRWLRKAAEWRDLAGQCEEQPIPSARPH